MIRTLEKRIVLFALLSLTIAIVVNTAFHIENYRRDYRESVLLRSESLAGGIKDSIEKVLGFGLPLHGLSGINERCSTIAESDPDIAYVLIEDQSGAAVFGSESYLDFDSSTAHLSRVKGDNLILGFPGLGDYYDVQKPLYDTDGSVAGRVRIGFPLQVLTDKTASMIERSVYVLVAAFAIATIFIILFVKRDVVRPVRELEQVASEISGGHFDVEVPAMMTSELDELANSIREMADSLKSREAEIQQNYVVLEESNRQLRDSYTRQEEIGLELGRSREMYRSLLEDASDAILVSDEDNRIVMINKAAEALFAISRQRAEGVGLVDFFVELEAEEAEGIAGLFLNVLHGQSLETEIRFVRPSDKRSLVGWAKCSPVVGQDSSRVVQTIVRDITHEIEVKENLEKSAAELERLNEMKDSFLGVASHELKTPLTVILGYTELLLGDMAPMVGEQILPMVEHINRSAERLSAIVRDMVDVTLLDNQNISLRCRNVELQKLVGNVADELEFFLRKRNQALVLDLDAAVKEIWCDEERMNQVLTNLLSNAIKFTPDQGTVTVSTRYYSTHRPPAGTRKPEQSDIVEISGTDYPYVQIAISDTGIGIAEKDQAHIFDKFYEAGEIEGHFTAQSAFRGRGTGLGLTIAKGFVDLHDGVIWVESDGHDPENCPGSTFFILIPAVQKPAGSGLSGSN